MSTIAIVHENVPGRSTLIDALKPDVTVSEFSASACSNATRIGLIWENSSRLQTIPFGSTVHPNFTWFSQELVDLFSLNFSATVDFITCNLGIVSSFLTELAEIEILFPQIVFEYSLDETGTMEGNWIMESSNTDIKPIYFTEEIDEWRFILWYNSLPYNFLNDNIRFTTPITLKTITNSINNSAYTGTSDVPNVVSFNGYSQWYVMLLSNGSVKNVYGGTPNNITSLNSDVIKIFAGNNGVFSALKSNGSLVTWYETGSGYGFGGDSSTVASQLTSGVVNVFYNYSNAVALDRKSVV